MRKKNYEDATKLVEEVQQSLVHQNGKVIELLHAKVAEESMLLTIAKIEKEIPSMNDYNVVVEKLQVLSGLPNKETEPTRHKLSEKMIEIIEAEVTSLLNNNQFSDAFAAVEKGLIHLPENDQLQSLKNEIEDKKIEFEEQEQKRIQHAKQKAAEEDHLNRTAAIELTDISIELDEWGYNIYGTVISKGTRPFSNIAVHYKVTDKNGFYVTEYSVYTTPNVLYPGESASFSMRHFGTYDYLYVQANQITWIIE